MAQTGHGTIQVLGMTRSVINCSLSASVSSTQPILRLSQARRQDLAAGWGVKIRWWSQNQNGGHIFKIQYCMQQTGIVCSNRGAKHEMGAPISNGGGGRHCPPRWRRPWT